MRDCRECKYAPEWAKYQKKDGCVREEGYCQWAQFHKIPTPYKNAKTKRLKKWCDIECECWEHQDSKEAD